MNFPNFTTFYNDVAQVGLKFTIHKKVLYQLKKNFKDWQNGSVGYSSCYKSKMTPSQISNTHMKVGHGEKMLQ